MQKNEEKHEASELCLMSLIVIYKFPLGIRQTSCCIRCTVNKLCNYVAMWIVKNIYIHHEHQNRICGLLTVMIWDKIANDWKSTAYFNFEYLGRIWAEHTGASIVNLQAVKRSSCGRTPKWAPWLHSISWLSYNKYNRCDRFKRSCVWKRHMKRAALLHLKSLLSNK